MAKSLLSDIEKFMADYGIGEHRFGMLAIKNGRLVERLRDGRRVWPETEEKIKEFLIAERVRRGEPRQSQAAE